MMVVRNNYFWLPKESKAGFIANGDIIEITKIGGIEERYGIRFIDATIRLIDYPAEPEYEVKMLLDTIMANTPSLTVEENKRFYQAVSKDYMHIPSKRDRAIKIKADPYFNALQVKFAYAVTCHKSQGGQWKAVFVDQGYLTDDSVDVEYLRWLYTAFTRATEKLYLVNFHEKFFTE
jgi:exodeoxyribonuclease-5